MILHKKCSNWISFVRLCQVTVPVFFRLMNYCYCNIEYTCPKRGTKRSNLSFLVITLYCVWKRQRALLPTVLGLAMWRIFSSEVHKSSKCLFLYKCSLEFRQPPYCQTDVGGSFYFSLNCF